LPEIEYFETKRHVIRVNFDGFFNLKNHVTWGGITEKKLKKKLLGIS
jgi:hypothetical protein